MTEVGKALSTWRQEQGKVVANILYSDIGKSYYSELGWRPNDSNWHVEFIPRRAQRSSSVEEIREKDLAALCEADERMIRAALATPTDSGRDRFIILPDLDHKLWHIRKDDFATKYLFGKIPQLKGAIAGTRGNRVWAVWTHRYYGQPSIEPSMNVLYILRLVLEGGESDSMSTVDSDDPQRIRNKERAATLKAVLRAALNEAVEWKLDYIKLWEPSSWILSKIVDSHIPHRPVVREEESIASVMMYDKTAALDRPPVWINNEHYAWC